jgi:ribosomal protein S18 acetylase RimI-like enzyme
MTSTDGLQVRDATEADLDAMAEMAGALAQLHHDLDPKRFMLVPDVVRGYRWWFGKELASKEAILLVAEHDGRIEGYAYGRHEERDWNLLVDRHAALHDIFVREDARRGGVASALIERFKARAKAGGAPRVLLHTATSNTRAQAAFARAGFRSTMIEMTCELEP